jgi:hypothetical protein
MGENFESERNHRSFSMMWYEIDVIFYDFEDRLGRVVPFQQKYLCSYDMQPGFTLN